MVRVWCVHSFGIRGFIVAEPRGSTYHVLERHDALIATKPVKSSYIVVQSLISWSDNAHFCHRFPQKIMKIIQSSFMVDIRASYFVSYINSILSALWRHSISLFFVCLFPQVSSGVLQMLINYIFAMFVHKKEANLDKALCK